MMDAHTAVERSARNSYSRLLAYLAAQSRDVAASEDALSEAFRTALEVWPRSGVPANPDGWLLAAARRRLIDHVRHARVEANAVPDLLRMTEKAEELLQGTAEFPDERLKLLFICAHPAIDAAIRTPLMLQVVLGLDAARIATAFLVKPATMGQRLSRAKTKIRDARIAFEIPGRKELPERLEFVLEGIYGAYNSGWDDIAGADEEGRKGLAFEAIELGRLLLTLMPEEPEVRGLLALMLHCEARRGARRSRDGRYVPLSAQDISAWSRPMITDAETLLAQAARAGQSGRFQLEAAIQSAHAHRLDTGTVAWEQVALLYEGLVRVAPTAGAQVGRVAALAEWRGAATAWEHLQAIPREQTETYQPYWALAGHLLRSLGRHGEAATAYERAIALTSDEAVQEFLRGQMRPA